MPQPPVFLAARSELQQDLILLSGAEGRHAAAVRRLRPGERADVADGAGLVAECVVMGMPDEPDTRPRGPANASRKPR